AQFSSLMGANISGFAIPTVAAASLGANAQEMALLLGVQAAIYPIFGIFAGSIVDRCNKPSVIALMDAARAACMLVVVFLVLNHRITITELTLLTSLVALAGVFRDVAAQSIVPLTLDIGDYS